MSKNKYNLSREIESDIKRIVRKNSGYGCVICGCAIIEYEHVDPEFHNAKEHNSSNITLLCPNHHSMVTTGKLTKETVKKHMKNPHNLTHDNLNNHFDIGDEMPIIIFGGNRIENTPVPIKIENIELFKITKCNKSNNFLLSAFFKDSKGNDSLKIVNNEWYVPIKNVWDFQYIGNKIKIREKKGRICLELTIKFPNEIIVDKIKMSTNQYYIEGNENKFTIYSIKNNLKVIEMSSCIASNCNVGFSF